MAKPMKDEQEKEEILFSVESDEKMNEEPKVNTSTVKTEEKSVLNNKEISLYENKMSDENKEKIKKNIREYFKVYIDNMTPGKPTTLEVCANMQFYLYNTLKSFFTLYQDQQSFNIAWEEVLSIFREYKDKHFDDKYAYRAPQAWKGGQADYKMFVFLINLCQNTCEVKERKKYVTQINTSTLLNSGFNENQKNKLISFYGLV